MTSTFHGLEIGKRALYAQQTALSTTGHNISNSNTIGYTRQRAELQATKAIPVPSMNTTTSPAQLGTGVEVNKIVRLREDYLDVQYRGENKNLGYWEAKGDTLSKVEELLNEPSETGLSHVMDQFWNSWQELAKNPDSAAARAVVRQSGVAVADTFNYFSNSLTQMKTDLNTVINTKTNEVNSLASQIASLNDQISRLVPNNYQPNDLYDQRDLLLDQLSKIVNVNTVPDKNGMVTVSIGDGVLVSGNKASKLTIGFDSATNLIDPQNIKLVDPDQNEKTVTLESGELMGRIESYGTTKGGIIPDIQSKLNEMVNEFATAINNQHAEGLNLNNIKGDKTPVVPFFTGTTADTISVNSDIMKSLDLIAAASIEVTNADGTTTSSSGNGKNAQAIADIRSKNTIDLNGTTTTINDYFQNIIAQLGIDSQEAGRMVGNSDVIMKQVDNRRQSVSGVSLDEETSNMIMFQQAYNAAARMVSVMDECLDKVINGMGRVGL
ncbi:flagellar hook-associated protein FlgK [Neobacillus sp. LXY-1]|uniref:flagellar hook-associated protein FlgK n=1 Tax=Neobacillus sp. LXY-1 TaxID=3379133 RepID=UPI003EDED787